MDFSTSKNTFIFMQSDFKTICTVFSEAVAVSATVTADGKTALKDDISVKVVRNSLSLK